MKTPIVYTAVDRISEDLRDILLEFSFSKENLKEIKEGLVSANADYEGLYQSEINEITKILKTEKEVMQYNNNI